MKLNIQGKINILIGIILLNNLYLLSGVIGIPNNLIIVLCLVISLYYSLKNIDKQLYVNLTNNWSTIFLIMISIPLFFIDWLLNKSTPSFNDLIRIIIYSLYFSWTFSYYNSLEKIKNWFIIVSITSFLILTLQGLFESTNPLAFSLILSTGNIEKRLLTRIAGTLIDSSCYSGILCIYLYIIYKYWYSNTFLKTLFFTMLCIICFYLTDLSGSRQSLLMIIFLLVYIIFNNLNLKKLILIFTLIALFLITTFASWNQITTYMKDNPSSSVARFIDGENSSQSSKSTEERKFSLISGAALILDNYFIYGPGLLNFNSRWENFSQYAVPHNGFIYLFAQYGIWAIISFYILFKVGQRSTKVNSQVLYILFLIHFFLYPNIMYYGTTFFVYFFIDSQYLLQNKEPDPTII